MASNKRSIILTSTRSLMTQYMDDFEEIGMVDIQGRVNYPCDLKPDYTCEDGKAARCPYWGSVACPYSQAEIKVRSSSLVVTNYAKWFSTSKFNGPFEGFQQLILDEAHGAPEALSATMQILLHHKEVEEVLEVPFLNGSEAGEFINWKRWAKGAWEVCNDAVTEAAKRMGGVDPKASWVRHYTHMCSLQQRLMTLSTANPKDWIVDELEDGFQFDPIRPAKYAELKLFSKIPRIILTSATIRPKTLFMLGLSKERFDFLEFPSDFDSSRCPTYHIPTMRNDHRQSDFTLLYLKADQIMARRGDRKGVIHTISWKRRDEVLDCSKYSSRMLSNIKGESATAIIERFKASPPPTVLVSPSMGTGVDFADEACEYQIILKIPFQDGRSKIVKARQEADPEYGPYQAMQNLVQMVGRGMRSKSDMCESFILDDHASWFIPRYAGFAPKSFHQFYKETNIIPSPPSKLILIHTSQNRSTK